MKKYLIILLLPLLVFTISCEDENDTSEYLPTEVTLWGTVYSVENTDTLNFGFFNQLTGEIPPEIGYLINLKYLNLYNNYITGEIPPEIGNLTNLRYLSLGSNQGNNQLTGEIPPEIGNLTNLTSLLLGNNQLTGEIPPEIGNLTNLVHLQLRGNQLTGEIPEYICELSFGINNNQFCPPYPSCIEDYVGEQDISNCN